MSVFQPRLCQQCRTQSAQFKHDTRTGDYEIACGRCGRRERHESLHDEEGFYCGFRHEVGQGFGVLFFRFAGGHEFHLHSLHTPRQVGEAESWLWQRLRIGAVDAATASLSRWNDEVQQIESVLGERVDVLAGKIIRMSGVPGDVERTIEATAGPRVTKRQCDD